MPSTTATPPYSHPHAGRTWVKIDLRDNLSGLHPTFLTNPDEFQPVLCDYSQRMETWGINEQEADEYDDTSDGALPAWLMRRMNTQMMYLNADPPEDAFLKVLRTKKIAQLQERGEEDRGKRDYLIKIVMTQMEDENGEPMVWRKLRVGGAVKLAQLQDKIIQPAMGWVRNYHGYLFTDRTDGALFGPKDGNHVDMMHLYMNGHLYIPDLRYTLANVLPTVGSVLGYTYDLGDHWTHDIIVEEIFPESESTGHVELISGSGACPPEDHNGNRTWLEDTLPLIRSGDHEKIHAVAHSLNYRGDPKVHRAGWTFDEKAFDLGAARRRIRDALQSKASVVSGAKSNVMTFGGRDAGLFGTGPRGAGYRTTETDNEEYGGVGTMIETVKDKADSRGVALCENCGSPSGLKRCVGCSDVWYCSKECQKSRWPQHKKKCGSKVKNSGDDKGAASGNSDGNASSTAGVA